MSVFVLAAFLLLFRNPEDDGAKLLLVSLGEETATKNTVLLTNLNNENSFYGQYSDPDPTTSEQEFGRTKIKKILEVLFATFYIHLLSPIIF
jgi:hypothetical protein